MLARRLTKRSQHCHKDKAIVRTLVLLLHLLACHVRHCQSTPEAFPHMVALAASNFRRIVVRVDAAVAVPWQLVALFASSAEPMGFALKEDIRRTLQDVNKAPELEPSAPMDETPKPAPVEETKPVTEQKSRRTRCRRSCRLQSQYCGTDEQRVLFFGCYWQWYHCRGPRIDS